MRTNYSWDEPSHQEFKLKEQVHLETLVLDLRLQVKGEFEEQCSDFVTNINTILVNQEINNISNNLL